MTFPPSPDPDEMMAEISLTLDNIHEAEEEGFVLLMTVNEAESDPTDVANSVLDSGRVLLVRIQNIDGALWSCVTLMCACRDSRDIATHTNTNRYTQHTHAQMHRCTD